MSSGMSNHTYAPTTLGPQHEEQVPNIFDVLVSTFGIMAFGYFLPKLGIVDHTLFDTLCQTFD